MSDRFETIIHALLGTCNSLDVILDQNNGQDLRDDQEFLTELDQQIFLCHACGWWCEISEENSEFAGSEELICLDCS